MGKIQWACGFLSHSFLFLSFFPPFRFMESGLFPGGETSLVGEASSGNREHWLRSQLKPFCSHGSYCWKNHYLLEMFSEKNPTHTSPVPVLGTALHKQFPKAPYLGGASTKVWDSGNRPFQPRSGWVEGSSSGLLLGAEEGCGDMKIPPVVCPASLNPAAPILPSVLGRPNFTRTVTSLGAPRAHP